MRTSTLLSHGSSRYAVNTIQHLCLRDGPCNPYRREPHSLPAWHDVLPLALHFSFSANEPYSSTALGTILYYCVPVTFLTQPPRPSSKKQKTSSRNGSTQIPTGRQPRPEGQSTREICRRRFLIVSLLLTCMTKRGVLIIEQHHRRWSCERFQIGSTNRNRDICR